MLSTLSEGLVQLMAVTSYLTSAVLFQELQQCADHSDAPLKRQKELH